MAEINELSDVEKEFLGPFLPKASYFPAEHGTSEDAEDHAASRPFVTLTYASSLDSMISLAPGVSTALSGLEAKSMTHYLRLNHDAILVGAGTARADNPRLNCRYPGVTLETQPRPIVLDPSGRWPFIVSKSQQLAAGRKGKEPWIIRNPNNIAEYLQLPWGDQVLLVGSDGLQNPSENTDGKLGYIEWHSIFKALKQKGIESVMIEGGATVINELLSQPHLVDSVIVTIAPTWLGHGGVAVCPATKTKYGQRTNAASLEGTAWQQFGQDVVLCGRLLQR